MAIPESAGERVQRALNDAKRAEIAEKFGGRFIEGPEPLPADVESEFLQRIEEFELRWASHGMTTVRAFVGDPPVRPTNELDDTELVEELGYLMATLEENDVAVDFGERPDDREVYRFIVEDLLDHEMDDIRVPGMVCHFIYEEFHPNVELDARNAAEWFLAGLLARNEYLALSIQRMDAIDVHGLPIDLESVRMRVAEFYKRIATVIDHDVNVTACHIEGADAAVELELRMTGLESGTMNQMEARGMASVRLRRGRCEDWEVVAFALPGGF